MKKKLSKWLLEKGLRLNFLYWLAAHYLKRREFPLEATRFMTLAGLEQAREAYRAVRPVVWTSAFFPVELVYAAGAIPFSPEVGAAVVAGLGLAPRALAAADAGWLASELCSFHRCAYGATLEGYFPAPHAFAASSHLCDGAPKLFSTLAAKLKKPYFLLDVPASPGPEATAYVAAQLKSFIPFLEEVTKRHFDEEKLKEAIFFSNRARESLAKVNALRRAVPAPLRGEQALNYLYLFFAGHGSSAAAKTYELLLQEVAARVARREEALPAERYRLLWLHVRPYFPTSFWEELAAKGAVIAFEEFTHVYWEPLDPERPFESLAQKALAHFALDPLKRAALAVRLAREYAADGVVHFSHWGCRQSCGGVRLIKEALQEEGIPFLTLDGDCIDQRNWSAGQVRTRLEGFLELLEGEKCW